MIKLLRDPISHPEPLGAAQWFIPCVSQNLLLDNEVDEPITGPIELKDKVQAHASWIEILLPYALSSLVLGTITMPAILYHTPARLPNPLASSEQTSTEYIVIPDLHLEAQLQEAATESRVVARANAPAPATALPATAEGTTSAAVPQPPEPPVSLPQAPLNLEVR